MEDSLARLPSTTQEELEIVLGKEFSIENRQRVIEAKIRDSKIQEINAGDPNRQYESSVERGYIFEKFEEEIDIGGR